MARVDYLTRFRNYVDSVTIFPFETDKYLCKAYSGHVGPSRLLVLIEATRKDGIEDRRDFYLGEVREHTVDSWKTAINRKNRLAIIRLEEKLKSFIRWLSSVSNFAETIFI